MFSYKFVTHDYFISQKENTFYSDETCIHFVGNIYEENPEDKIRRKNKNISLLYPNQRGSK